MLTPYEAQKIHDMVDRMRYEMSFSLPPVPNEILVTLWPSVEGEWNDTSDTAYWIPGWMPYIPTAWLCGTPDEWAALPQPANLKASRDGRKAVEDMTIDEIVDALKNRSSLEDDLRDSILDQLAKDVADLKKATQKPTPPKNPFFQPGTGVNIPPAPGLAPNKVVYIYNPTVNPSQYGVPSPEVFFEPLISKTAPEKVAETWAGKIDDDLAWLDDDE